MLDFFRNRRRRRWLEEFRPPQWQHWLRDNVWQYKHLDARQQEKVQQFVCILQHEKDWVGGAGFAVTEEMQVTIAGQAALLTLGFEKPYFFERLKTIIVYAGTFSSRPTSSDALIMGELGQHINDFSARTGESWQGGPIILSWDAVLREGRHDRLGRNVVVHEFAHHMDSLDGNTNGAPPLTDRQFEKRWYQVTDAEYQQLLQLTHHGKRSLLDSYGATNQAEFFAVSTECFFTRPHALAAQHQELHAVLTRLFGQDPREWLPNR